MAVVLDAFALLALTLDEPAAEEVETLLRRGSCRISSVNMAEALDQLGRIHKHPVEELRAAFDPIVSEVLDVVAVDVDTAWRAAELRRRHYRRRGSQLSLADCFAAATVRSEDALVTADPPLTRAAKAEGIEVLALPDSRGRRP